MMNLNDLFEKRNLDPCNVLVFRHRPREAELNKVLPWLASEKPNLFNAYQQTQEIRLEKVMKKMTGNGYVASFIGHEPGKALFVGVYSIIAYRPLTYEEFWEKSEFIELKEKYKMIGWSEEKTQKPYKTLWFDLELTSLFSDWKGKLIVTWPPPERSWWRRAHRNNFLISAILQDSVLVPTMKKWDEMILSWDELKILPELWKTALTEWRGIYYIHDISDNMGYVGSAYGKDNLFGRWIDYAKRGHGGNKYLRGRNPQNFMFSILQRVSPDMNPSDVIQIESSWKERLHTRFPRGLNDN